MTGLEKPPAATRDSPAGASVLARILSILEAVKELGPSATITDIATLTGMPKSTVSRLTAALVDQRYLARTDGGVELGLRLFELGARVALPRRLRAAAAPVLRELGEITGERVGVWIHQGSDMVSVATVAGRLPMLPTRVGSRTPALTTASGKAFLAFCPDARVVEQVSAPLVRDAVDSFRRELHEVKARSVAYDGGVAYPGVLAVASPVLSGGRVVGAVSIAGPQGSVDADRLAPLVQAAGLSLTRRMAAA